jgi:hypothetical protein
MLMTYRANGQSGGRELCTRLALVIGVLLLVSCSPKRDVPQEGAELTPAILVPVEWTPSLEQVQENMEESLAARPNQSQQALRGKPNLADLADARLFIAYGLLCKLDEKDRALFDRKHGSRSAALARATVVSKEAS